jgi:hyperosmotically inducible protein
MVFDHLDFRVDGGTVTLLGQVNRAPLKSDAEKAVKQIPGVRSVKNEIEVLPVSAADEKLRLAEYLAIFQDALLNQYALRAIPPIHIIVKNGAVTLEGLVASEADKTEAFTKASGVPGVTSLTNHLQVAP